MKIIVLTFLVFLLTLNFLVNPLTQREQAWHPDPELKNTATRKALQAAIEPKKAPKEHHTTTRTSKIVVSPSHAWKKPLQQSKATERGAKWHPKKNKTRPATPGEIHGIFMSLLLGLPHLNKNSSVAFTTSNVGGILKPQTKMQWWHIIANAN